MSEGVVAIWAFELEVAPGRSLALPGLHLLAVDIGEMSMHLGTGPFEVTERTSHLRFFAASVAAASTTLTIAEPAGTPTT